MYFVLKPPLSGRFCAAGCARSPARCGDVGLAVEVELEERRLAPAPRSATRSSTGRSSPVTSRMAAPIRPRKCPSIQSRVKSLGTARTKPVAVQLEAVRLPEPGSVRGVVECPSEPTGNFAPQALRSQLDLVLHPAPAPCPLVNDRAASIPTCENTANGGILQVLPPTRQSLHSCGKRWGKLRFSAWFRGVRLWKVGGRLRGYTGARCGSPDGGFFATTPFFSNEAHLSAQRPPPQAQARLPCAHVDARRPADPQAPSRQGPRPPLGVTLTARKLENTMKRANRLSR